MEWRESFVRAVRCPWLVTSYILYPILDVAITFVPLRGVQHGTRSTGKRSEYRKQRPTDDVIFPSGTTR